MARFDASILDMTDDYYLTGDGEVLDKVMQAIANDLERKVEILAASVAHGCSVMTEQGIPFTAYANGAIKLQGESGRRIQSADLTKVAQIAAMQEAATSTYECVVANKPPEADLLIWRIRPEASRCLKTDGLDVKIYTRLAWDKLRTEV